MSPFETVRQIFTPFVFSLLCTFGTTCVGSMDRRDEGGGATFHVSDKNRKDEKSEDKLACAGYHLASVWESAKACVEAVSISFCSTLSCQPGVLVSMPFDDCSTVGQLFAPFVRSGSPVNA